MDLFDNRSSLEKQGVLHFDGSCRMNPGPAHAGYVLKCNGVEYSGSHDIGQGTNNIAEYKALIFGLEAALRVGVDDLEAYGDSLIVVNGMKRGRRPGGKPHLLALRFEALNLVQRLRRFEISWIPREENSQADVHSRASGELEMIRR